MFDACPDHGRDHLGPAEKMTVHVRHSHCSARALPQMVRVGGEVKDKGAERKRILLIGEKPDAWLFAMLQEEGYEVAALESSCRVWGIHRLYRPHFIVVHLRYPKDLAMLEECVAMGNGVPVVAAFSILTKKALMNAVKEKAASFIILPAKPKTIRETLRSLELSEDEGKFPSAGKESLGTD